MHNINELPCLHSLANCIKSTRFFASVDRAPSNAITIDFRQLTQVPNTSKQNLGAKLLKQIFSRILYASLNVRFNLHQRMAVCHKCPVTRSFASVIQKIAKVGYIHGHVITNTVSLFVLFYFRSACSMPSGPVRKGLKMVLATFMYTLRLLMKVVGFAKRRLEGCYLSMPWS